MSSIEDAQGGVEPGKLDTTFSWAVEPGEKIGLVAAVYQALGAASVCWTESPKGIFMDGFANEVATALLAVIDTERPAVEMSAERVFIRQGKDGDWYWQRRARNGRSISVGGEGYTNLSDCQHMAHRLNPDVPATNFSIVPRDHGKVAFPESDESVKTTGQPFGPSDISDQI